MVRSVGTGVHRGSYANCRSRGIRDHNDYEKAVCNSDSVEKNPNNRTKDGCPLFLVSKSMCKGINN